MFKLLRYFSITSLIVFIIVAILLAVFYRQIILRDLINVAENKNVALTQAFSNSLWPQFAPFVISVSELTQDELQTRPEIAQLHQAVLAQMNGLSVIKIKIYNLDGLTVFSTESGQIGEDKSDNAGFLAARSGQVASELTHRDTFSAFEGTIEDRNVFSSYIPIRRGGSSGPIEGVFEIYDDVTPLIQRIERSQRNVIGGVTLILASLYIVLFFIVRRADQIIQHQYVEHQQAEEALQLTQFSVDSSSDSIFWIGPDAHFLSVNNGACKMLGYSSKELRAMTVYDIDPKVTPAWWSEHWAELKEAGVLIKESQHRTKDGRLIPVEAHINFLEFNGKEYNFAHVRDITERKQSEEVLILARDQALAASHLKTELLAKVSHELRTPLSTILGFAEMLNEHIYGPVYAEQEQVITKIIDSTQDLTKLVNELLDQAQLDAGKLKLNINSFAPRDIINHVRARMNVLAQAKGLKLTADIGSDVPATLCGDSIRIQQIVMNLVNNAIKFTKVGTVQIRLYQPDPQHWAIQVSDTGPGIPSEAQSYIFEPFRQVDGAVTREHGGTGLGLSIVQQLTTLMDGQIILDSEVGRGSTFTLLLPLVSTQEKIA